MIQILFCLPYAGYELKTLFDFLYILWFIILLQYNYFEYKLV